jgi:acetyl-CoA acyltransferase 2
MASALKGIFLVAAKRTPLGTYGGKLVNHTCVDLQEIAAKAALAAGGVRPDLIDSVCIGSVISVRHKFNFLYMIIILQIIEKF